MSNCVKHPDTAASAYCRTCGKALCSSCTRDVRGVVYCEECLAARMEGTMPPPGTVPPGPTTPEFGPEPVSSSSPGLAAILGFIPGVGAMYNGQFAKGFVHLVIFVTLIWLSDHASDLFGFGIAAWVFYMVFDAYQTAKAMKFGLPLPDPLGINGFVSGQQESWRAHGGAKTGTTPAYSATAGSDAGIPPPATGQPYVAPTAIDPPPPREATPTGAVILIGLGVLFLLGNMGILHGMRNWWPIFLIALGLWLVYKRQQRSA